MFKNFIISFLIISNLITAAFCFRYHYRLERTRQLVEHYRTELNAAEDQQREIAESIQRTSEILDSSISTVAELRNAIGEIRKNYESMEAIINSTRSSSTNDNSSTNNEGDLK